MAEQEHREPSMSATLAMQARTADRALRPNSRLRDDTWATFFAFCTGHVSTGSRQGPPASQPPER